MGDLTLPVWSTRSIAIWLRNLRVWQKLAVPATLANFGEPVLYLLGLGYGLGQFIGEIQGLPYRVFLASGIVCSSAMNSATFEALYSAYTRMSVQRTWEAIANTPVSIDDIVIGEILWAGTKSLFSVSAVLLVAALLGLVHDWHALWVLPMILATGICFGSMGLVITAFATSYEFFLYYMTLLITPMMLLSGVFFPLEAMPDSIQQVAQVLPLTHVVAIIRPLMTGGEINNLLIHLAVIAGYTGISICASVVLIRRRLSR